MWSTLQTLRRILLAVFTFGTLGGLIELVLLEHTEDVWQWVPLVLLTLGLAGAGLVAFRAGPRVVWTFRGLMVLFVLAGGVGLFMHYRGNAAFELEMRPNLERFELFRESIMGATPALAPGMMVQLGLLGLALTYRHPSLTPRDHRSSEEGGHT